jgi:hypothetical protein
MTLQTVTVNLPQVLYRRLERAAQATNQPLDAVLLQSIRGNIPPSLDDVPADMRGDLRQLLKLNDDDLWAVASASIDAKQWRRHQRLLRKNTTGVLSEREQRELENLRGATDRQVMRRSFAVALLKWRGHTLPAPPANHARA